MKQASKEIEEEDDRKNNVVILTGLNLNPVVTENKQQEEHVRPSTW